MNTRACKKCGQVKPLTTEYFNLLSTGNWRWTCKKCMAAASRRHHQENPEMTAERRARYNANLRAASGSYNEDDIRRIRERLGDRCAYCGAPLHNAGDVEHMTPLSRGGTNDSGNLTLACVPCNRDKNNKTATEFITWRRRLGLKVRIESQLFDHRIGRCV